METFVGSIVAFGFNYAPKGWAQCMGQLMSIQQNTTLYALLGVQFGGDGKVNFALPNLQGKAPIGQGNNYNMGKTGGANTVTLDLSHLPAHTHAGSIAVTVPAFADAGDTNSPLDGYLASIGNPQIYTAETPDAAMASFNAPVTVSATGSGSPLSTVDPSLVINYCIALTGFFPQRQ